jgi:hypothetical protein
LERRSLKKFDASGKSPAYSHHRKNSKSPRRETGRGFFHSKFLNRTAAAHRDASLPVSALPRDALAGLIAIAGGLFMSAEIIRCMPHQHCEPSRFATIAFRSASATRASDKATILHLGAGLLAQLPRLRLLHKIS